MKTAKNIFAAVAAVVLAATPFAGRGVTIDVTRMQQRYPWNGLVDIDYTITLADGEQELDPVKHRVEISVVNCDETPAVTNVAHVFRQGELPVSAGGHRVTWDANAEGINYNARQVQIFATVVYHAERYMVIDVHEGTDATVYPVTYMTSVPEGGFTNDEYRSDKIVLRLIPPGSFVMGSPTTEPGRTADREVQHPVAITAPFYMGVFEITQTQYMNVTGAKNPSTYQDLTGPVEKASYNDIRGTANTSTHEYDWPWTNGVASASFMGKIRSKCREWNADTQAYDIPVDGLFDLPTEAQWEYACRAGMTTPYNNGTNCANTAALDKQIKLLGQCGGCHTVSGSYLPNAWGLYDMHGNVMELCRDWYRTDVQNIENPALDPVGPANGEDSAATRVKRGGGWKDGSTGCRSASRDGQAPGTGSYNIGFRLSCTLP